MRNPILAVTIAFVLAAPCTALAGDKNKNKAIEVQDYGFGVSIPVTTSRSDGGGATIKRNTSGTVKQNYQPQKPDGSGLRAQGTLGGSTGPTKPPLPTTGTQHR